MGEAEIRSRYEDGTLAKVSDVIDFIFLKSAFLTVFILISSSWTRSRCALFFYLLSLLMGGG